MKKKIALLLVCMLLLGTLPIYSSEITEYVVKGIEDGYRFPVKLDINSRKRVIFVTDKTSSGTKPSAATNLKKAEFYIDNTLVATVTDNPCRWELFLNDYEEHSFSVKTTDDHDRTQFFGPYSYRAVYMENSSDSIIENFNGVSNSPITLTNASRMDRSTNISAAVYATLPGRDDSAMKLSQASNSVIKTNQDITVTENSIVCVDMDFYATKQNSDKLCFRMRNALGYNIKKGTFEILSAYANSSSNYDMNMWHHFSYEFDMKRGKYKAYLDGYEFESGEVDTRTVNRDIYFEFLAQRWSTDPFYVDNLEICIKNDAVLPQSSSFGKTNPANGSKYVAVDVGKVSFTADDISPLCLKYGTVTVEKFGVEEPSADDFGEILPKEDYIVQTEENKLNILFNTNLTAGVYYKITLNDKFFNSEMIEYTPASIIFRTRLDGENIPPEISIISPIENERFFTDNPITLSANATDEDGSVDYVEFYCDGELIENSKVVSDTDTYTFIWENPTENFGGSLISAVACDNEGEKTFSDEVKIKIVDYHSPEVNITAPENDEKIYHKIGGFLQYGGLKITADVSDTDGVIIKNEIFLDGNLIYENEKNLEVVETVYTEEISAGAHTVSIRVTDDDNLTTEASQSFESIDMGKQLPAVTGDSFDGAISKKWKKSGEGAEFIYKKLPSGDMGMSIYSPALNSKAASAVFKCREINETKSFIGEVDLSFSDNEHSRKVTICGSSDIDLLEFGDDGLIYVNGQKTEVVYEKNTAYRVSFAVNKKTKTLYYTLEHVLGFYKMAYADQTFTDGASVKITHTGAQTASETGVSNVGFFFLKEAANVGDIFLVNDNGERESFTECSLEPKAIFVNLENGTDGNTLERNVEITDLFTNKKLNLSKNGNSLLINNVLKPGRSYQITVRSGLADNMGCGLSGDYCVNFTTKKENVYVSAEKVHFTSDSEVITKLSESTLSPKFVGELENTASFPITCTVVCVVYDKNTAKNIYNRQYTLPENTTIPFELSAPIMHYTQDTHIQAFVINSLEQPLPVGDIYFEIN